jgi:uncharacterized membrane protein
MAVFWLLALCVLVFLASKELMLAAFCMLGIIGYLSNCTEKLKKQVKDLQGQLREQSKGRAQEQLKGGAAIPPQQTSQAPSRAHPISIPAGMPAQTARTASAMPPSATPISPDALPVTPKVSEAAKVDDLTIPYLERLEPEAPPAVPATPKIPEPPKGAAPIKVAEQQKIKPPPRAPVPPRQPPQPSMIEKLIKAAFIAAKDWLLGGNTVVRVGLVVFFVGLALLLGYASEHYTLPVELRYIGVSAVAFVLLGTGWRLRLKKPSYALLLQGGGIAVLYLTTFAALRLHSYLMPTEMAFAILVALTAAAVALAVMQDAMGLACAAVLGGFAAPILVSTGGGNHVLLFSYFALLNVGIALIAWFKAWRVLNLIGFIGTFGVGIAWGLQSYDSSKFASTEPFMIFFLLLYVLIGLLFARRKLIALSGNNEKFSISPWSEIKADYLDGTLTFGPPLIGFGLQCAVISHIEFGMAFSAFVLGLLYLVLAFCLRGRPAIRLMAQVYLALGVVFGTLAIPLALSAQWTSAAWALEGAGIYWIAHVQRRPLARAFSLSLILVATLLCLKEVSLHPYFYYHEGYLTTVLNGSWIGAMLLGMAYLSCYYVRRYVSKGAVENREQPMDAALGSAGLAFLYLIPPLVVGWDGTVIAWALMGMATLFAGSRLASRAFITCAFVIQSFASVVFLVGLRIADDTILGNALLEQTPPFTAGLLGVAWLFGYLMRLYSVKKGLDTGELKKGRGIFFSDTFPYFALGFLYLIPPLVFGWDGTVIAWALMGMATLFAGIKFASRAFITCAFVIQSLASVVFLAGLRIVDDTILGNVLLEQTPPFTAGLLGVAWLFGYLMRLYSVKKGLDTGELKKGRGIFFSNAFPFFALGFLYLIPPLVFGADGTVIAWALMGIATLFAGTRLASWAFIVCAVVIQSLASVVFLRELDTGDGTTMLINLSPYTAGLLGVAWLFGYLMRLYSTRKGIDTTELKKGRGIFFSNAFPILGLAFLYLIPPLVLGLEGSVIAWAVMGMATLFAGVRLASWPFIACSFAIQAIGGWLFLRSLEFAKNYTLHSDGMGMLSAVLVGAALTVSAVLAQDYARKGKGVANLSAASASAVPAQDYAHAGRGAANLSAVPMWAGLFFINLTFLFMLDLGQVGAIWAASGLLILWLGLWRRIPSLFYFGLLLEVVAGFSFLSSHAMSFLAPNGWVAAALALAGFAGAWRLHHTASRSEPSRQGLPASLDPSLINVLSNCLLAWGVGWWVWCVAERVMFYRSEIGWFIRQETMIPVYPMLLVLSVSALLWMGLARVVKWRSLALACLLPFVLAALVLGKFGMDLLRLDAVVAWVALFLVHLLTLRRLSSLLPDMVQRAAHVAGVWLGVSVLMLATIQTLDLFMPDGQLNAWQWLSWAFVPSLYLWWAARDKARFWPVAAFTREYCLYAAFPVMAAMMLWFWLANLTSNGDCAPLPYIPLINPLELSLLLVLAACWRWCLFWVQKAGKENQETLRKAISIAGYASAVSVATLAVCRGAYAWAGVPFDLDSMVHSMGVQAAWSIVWMLVALVLMIRGSFRKSRALWLTGALLAGAVVFKLVFVELADHGGLPRIFSSLGVGLLLIIVGYFAPLPPKKEAEQIV